MGGDDAKKHLGTDVVRDETITPAFRRPDIELLGYEALPRSLTAYDSALTPQSGRRSPTYHFEKTSRQIASVSGMDRFSSRNGIVISGKNGARMA
jgi:hypothetical protein